jgi:tetratricopeptide (TPR) repeat protein
MKFKNWIVLTAIIICLSGFQAFACLNSIGEAQVGKRIEVEGLSVNEFINNFVSHKDRAYWEKIRSDLEVRRKDSSFLESRNNLAVAMIHLGQIQDAIKLLEALEKDKPGMYYTASNLGTAYELNGENEKALHWIRQGINRNEQSHFGTEWLHLKILETKIAMAKDANWLKNHSVLGMDFKNVQKSSDSKLYLTDASGQQRSLADIEYALVYQLHERLEFVKAPEPTVGDLLADLSRVFALSRSAGHAKAIEEMAINYGVNPNDKTKDINSSQMEITDNGKSNNYLYYTASAVIPLLLIGFVIFIVKKRALR